MSQSDDLSKLFQRFGGKAESYKEIVREDAATEARERWPLLSAVRVDHAATVPSVQPASAASEPAAPAAPLWRAAAPASEPPPAQAPASPMVAPVPPVPPVASPAAPAMAPRFRTPEGMPPAVSPARAAPAASPAAFVPHAPYVPAAPAAPTVAATPAPRQAAPWQPADAHAATGGTELDKVFARLEGRPEPAATSERAPARRSFLDRLNRS